VSHEPGFERLRFSVRDTGVGVEPAVAQLLFEPFAQASAETASRYGGTGLGLAICRRLAEMMGGTIEMQSALGRGTTMVLDVSFPVANVADASVIDLPTDAPQRRLARAVSGRRGAPDPAKAEREGTLVLVVDDHPTNRLVLSRQVSTLGYGLLTAEHGVEALALWKKHRVGLVLTDCNMPELNGYDLARTIRKLESEQGGEQRVPIVACTANALESEAARCLAAGMDDYLVKPVDLSELADRLDQWLPLPAGQSHGDVEPAPAPSIDEEALVDHAVLASVSGGDSAIERQILQDFRRVNDADFSQLAEAAEAGDAERIMHLVHRIKGASQSIGALGLMQVCLSMENAARARDVAQVREALPRLLHEVRRLDDYVERVMGGAVPAK
jgi:two-component system, NarL family, sensor histidine kinase EvgS